MAREAHLPFPYLWVMTLETKILIVDDDETMRQGLEEVLNEGGYGIATAENGMEALRKIENKAFDLVITDLVMPKVDGMDLLREIRKLRPNCLVIMITAFGTIDNAVEAMKRGANDYIVKPFEPSDFIIKVKRVLEEARFEERLLKVPTTLGRMAVLKSLSNPIRLGIVTLLDEEGKLRLIQIKKTLGIKDPPKLSFHLRELKSKGILEQDKNKIYSLSVEGKKVADYVRNLN